MDLKLYPLRFEFLAKEPVFFPPGKASNILRGAFGVIFRSIVCVPGCRSASECEIRRSCPYARLFEPVSDGTGPSGLADPPRPFVFRARQLDGQTVRPGSPFHFDVNVFSLETETLAYFVLTFAAIAREGVGSTRGKAELQSVRMPGHTIYSASQQSITPPPAPLVLRLEPGPRAVRKIRVDFLTPTELKHGQKIAERPDFPILFGRIRDRISTLRALYGGGPIEMDYAASGLRASQIQMIACRMRHLETGRRSTRTGQSHSIGGLVGEAEYEGDLAEFLPWLEAARYTGVGRQSVWGKGEIAVAF